MTVVLGHENQHIELLQPQCKIKFKWKKKNRTIIRVKLNKEYSLET